MDIRGITAAIRSHAMTIGQFERVLGHEPKSAPGKGLTLAMFVDLIRPVPSSGLSSTSALMVFMERIYVPMLSKPEDEIDIRIMEAVDALMAEYTQNLTLGGMVRAIDLMGMHGLPLAARAGYVEQDKIMYRAMVITLPVIVDDVWAQTA